MANRVRARRRPTGFQAQTTGLTGPIPPVTAKGVTGSMPPITSPSATGSMAPIASDGSSLDSTLGNGVTSTDGENRCYPESDDQPPRPESET